MHISVHSVHGAVRALTKGGVDKSTSARILFPSTFAIFANDSTSKCGIPDRLENQVPVVQTAKGWRTRRGSGSVWESTGAFRTFVGPVAADRTQGSLSLDRKDPISTMMTPNGRIKSGDSAAGAPLCLYLVKVNRSERIAVVQHLPSMCSNPILELRVTSVTSDFEPSNVYFGGSTI